MLLFTSKAPQRMADEPLACLLAFSAAGLFGSCLASMPQGDGPASALLKLVLIVATAPFAALTGLVIGRQS
jgi:hypothetical protein